MVNENDFTNEFFIPTLDNTGNSLPLDEFNISLAEPSSRNMSLADKSNLKQLPNNYLI